MPRRSFGGALLTIALAWVGACGGSEPLLVIAGPDDLLSLELRTAAGEILWRLESDAPRQIPWVVLGEVPAGFRQAVPPAGERPRELEPWEPLVIDIVSATREFHQTGMARGTRVFEMSDWSMEPRVQSEDTLLSDDGTPQGEEAIADESRR